ncbi:MAG: alpha-glucosidase [Anaerolineaceae bacterium]|nr:alpha-glucosidase [Anaerolineaceae bacterium]
MANEKKLWWKNGVIYQIYPRSFRDTNGDGIGDLPGIIEKLDYINGLGVDAIWLSPINPSPDADFGYDVADYNGIDAKYGKMTDFDNLVKEAHKRDLKIVLDLVLNHTSNQHPWFLESKKGPISPYHDWYIWRYPRPKYGFPNNWKSVFGGPAWEYENTCGKFYYHMFAPQQPDLNWRNPDVRKAMLNVFRFWLDKGVDGFRLDVFNEYFKDAQLRDNPHRPGLHLREFDRQIHKYDAAQPEMMPLLKEIRTLVDKYKERYIVGETFLVPPAQARTYIGPDKVHAAFDFGYTHSAWSAPAFGKAIQFWDALHGDEAWPNYVLNNHDTRRSASRYPFGNEDSRNKMLAAMHLTLRGTPFLYYGEEIGMRELELKKAEIQDPVGKYYWPINKGRDGCRTPMQWNSKLNAGFTSGKPWLRINSDYPNRNVAAEEEQPDSLLNCYKQLLRLRRENPALNSGTMSLKPLLNKNLLVYTRTSDKQKALIVLNFSILPQTYKPQGEWKMLYSGNDSKRTQLLDGILHMPPFGFAILTS